MKYYIFLLLSFILFIPGSVGCKEIHKVTIHVDDGYKPYSYKEKGEAKGIYIEILRKAFSKMKNFEVKLEPVPWNRGKQLMKKGEGFGLTPAFFHGHDWPYLYPYSHPYYTETVILLCNKKTFEKNRVHWPKDYMDLKIGNVSGFDGWGGKEFRELVKAKKIKYQEVSSATALIKAATADHFDCILMEKTAYKYHLKVNNMSKSDKKYLHQSEIIGKDEVYIGYSEKAVISGKYLFYYDFWKEFDSIIYQMKKSGEVKKIIKEYMK